MSLQAILNLNRAGSFTLKDHRRLMREQFITLALAIECHDAEVDYPENKLNALVTASGTIKERAKDGDETFRLAWLRGYKAEMKCDDAAAEAAYTFPHLEWDQVSAPVDWITEVGVCVGTQDAIETKAFYEFSRQQEKSGSTAV